MSIKSKTKSHSEIFVLNEFMLIQPFSKEDFQLRMNLTPIFLRPVHFWVIHGGQIKNFKETVIRWEYGFAFRHFSELPVESLNVFFASTFCRKLQVKNTECCIMENP